jgi:hypothetical protein
MVPETTGKSDGRQCISGVAVLWHTLISETLISETL